MRLVKHRPRIRLRALQEVHAGTIFESTVILDARREVQLDHLDVELVGHEELTVAAGLHPYVERREAVRMAGRLTERVRLPVGRSIFPCRFILPTDLPPSHAGRNVTAQYHLRVHASVPWWPDARASFEIFVRTNPESATGSPGTAPGQPRVISTEPEGPSAKEPHVEMSLGTDVVQSGGVLTGAVAVSNSAFNRYTGIRVHLIAEERVRLPRMESATEVERYRMRDPLRQSGDGDPVAFTLKVPAGIRPSAGSSSWSLIWYVEVEVERQWASSIRLRCPVTIAPDRSRSDAMTFAPPAVGSPRLKAIWTAVAAEIGMTLDDGSLRGSIEDITVALRREHRGGKGVFLVGELAYPSLGLGLELRSVRRLLGGFEIEVSGRERAQVEPIRSALVRRIPSGTMIGMGDERARFELRNGGQDPKRLAEFARSLMELARALLELRGAIPAPAALAAGVAGWQRLADRLAGRLDRGSMTVIGSFAGKPARVATTWGLDDRPLHTSVTLRAPFPLRNDPLPPGDRYAIQDDTIRADLPAPLLDPAPALHALSEMALLCESLGPSAGAYR